jgi:hypothetical protein
LADSASRRDVHALEEGRHVGRKERVICLAVVFGPNNSSMTRIYTSPVPSVPVLSTSIFTRLFDSPDPNTIGRYPASASAFIDSDSGTTLTRAQTKRLALSLAYGLRNHPTTLARRGDVIMIFAPNSLSWPVALFASSQCENSPSSCSHISLLKLPLACDVLWPTAHIPLRS